MNRTKNQQPSFGPKPYSSDRDYIPIMGLWQQIPLPMISRYLVQLGWDWVILDMQHSCFGFHTAYECIHVIRTGGGKPLVRTSLGSVSEIQKVLDLGAQGVIVPMVNSRAEAETLAQAAKYPPLGSRSMGGDPRLHYGEDYLERANMETLLLVQIEHLHAVERVGEILSVEGVDGCFVGPTDLALSMGLDRRNFELNPKHSMAIQQTVDVCRSLGKLACCNCYSLEDAQKKVVQGFECITLKSDAELFVEASSRLLSLLRKHASDSNHCGVDRVVMEGSAK